MSKKNKSGIIQMLSPENYIRQRARSLPIYECYANPDWQDEKIANVIITRRHINGNVTICTYLVDLLCLGVKDTSYFFNKSEIEYREFIKDMIEQSDAKLVGYTLAHNIIFAGIEFADEFGITPHKDFSSITSFMLEEDSEAIELIEIECGNDGKPLYMPGPYESAATKQRILDKLERNAGPGNYEYITEISKPHDFDEDMEDDDIENYDEDYDEEFGITYEEALSIHAELSDKLEYLDLSEFEKYSNAIERLFVELVDSDLSDQYYEEFIDDLDIEVSTDELPDEMLGIQQGYPGLTPNQQATYIKVYNLATENSKKALRLFEKFRKDLPESPYIAFLELHIIEKPGDPHYITKLQHYARQYPDYPLIRLHWLRYKAINENNNEPIDKEIRSLSEIFKNRQYIHEMEQIAYLYYCTFLVIINGDPSRISAYYQVISDLEIPDEITAPFLIMGFYIKVKLVKEYLSQSESI
jgi:hypothetical protein